MESITLYCVDTCFGQISTDAASAEEALAVGRKVEARCFATADQQLKNDALYQRTSAEYTRRINSGEDYWGSSWLQHTQQWLAERRLTAAKLAFYKSQPLALQSTKAGGQPWSLHGKGKLKARLWRSPYHTMDCLPMVVVAWLRQVGHGERDA